MSDKAITLHSSVGDDVKHWFLRRLPAHLGRRRRRQDRAWRGVHPRLLPLHWGTDQDSQWLLDAPMVVGFLQQMYSRLRRQRYAHTAVPDHRVAVYHDDGAAIEVIWSRRRVDDTEIERVAAHFELARGPAGWRIVGIQAAPTASATLDHAWPQTN